MTNKTLGTCFEEPNTNLAASSRIPLWVRDLPGWNTWRHTFYLRSARSLRHTPATALASMPLDDGLRRGFGSLNFLSHPTDWQMEKSLQTRLRIVLGF